MFPGHGGFSDYELEEFLREVLVMSRLSSPHIVQFHAACLTPPTLCIVTELMRCSLRQLLCLSSEPLRWTVSWLVGWLSTLSAMLCYAMLCYAMLDALLYCTVLLVHATLPSTLLW